MNLDYAKARENMVEQQVRPWDVLDPRVLDTLAAMPREAFVPDALRALAYADTALPLGDGEAMMKPVLEGRALQALRPASGESVLVIGVGGGYLAACLANLAREVVAVERRADLADAARARLARQGIGNVRIETADALAWDNVQQFDAICVTGAVEALPARFLQWLKPGGRLFAVRGHSPAMQATLFHNDVNGLRAESLFETDLPYLAGAAPQPHFAL